MLGSVVARADAPCIWCQQWRVAITKPKTHAPAERLEGEETGAESWKTGVKTVPQTDSCKNLQNRKPTHCSPALGREPSKQNISRVD